MKKERCEFMNDKGSTFLFNTISSVYGLFYGKQKRWFKNVIETAKKEIDIKQYKTIIDDAEFEVKEEYSKTFKR